MLVIRDAQMHTFREAMLREFEDNRLGDLSRRFPSQYNDLGREKVLAIIQNGIRTCERLGIHAERDVASFIDLMILYGESFNSDPKLQFQTELLHNSSIPGDARVALTMARLGAKQGSSD